jgi:hypothetical protein
MCSAAFPCTHTFVHNVVPDRSARSGGGVPSAMPGMNTGPDGCIPVSPGDTVTGIDDANISRLLTAICHAAGNDRDQQMPMQCYFFSTPEISA